MKSIKVHNSLVEYKLKTEKDYDKNGGRKKQQQNKLKIDNDASLVKKNAVTQQAKVVLSNEDASEPKKNNTFKNLSLNKRHFEQDKKIREKVEDHIRRSEEVLERANFETRLVLEKTVNAKLKIKSLKSVSKEGKSKYLEESKKKTAKDGLKNETKQANRELKEDSKRNLLKSSKHASFRNLKKGGNTRATPTRSLSCHALKRSTTTKKLTEMDKKDIRRSRKLLVKVKSERSMMAEILEERKQENCNEEDESNKDLECVASIDIMLKDLNKEQKKFENTVKKMELHDQKASAKNKRLLIRTKSESALLSSRGRKKQDAKAKGHSNNIDAVSQRFDNEMKNEQSHHENTMKIVHLHDQLKAFKTKRASLRHSKSSCCEQASLGNRQVDKDLVRSKRILIRAKSERSMVAELKRNVQNIQTQSTEDSIKYCDDDDAKLYAENSDEELKKEQEQYENEMKVMKMVDRINNFKARRASFNDLALAKSRKAPVRAKSERGMELLKLKNEVRNYKHNTSTVKRSDIKNANNRNNNCDEQDAASANLVVDSMDEELKKEQEQHDKDMKVMMVVDRMNNYKARRASVNDSMMMSHSWHGSSSSLTSVNKKKNHQVEKDLEYSKRALVRAKSEKLLTSGLINKTKNHPLSKSKNNIKIKNIEKNKNQHDNEKSSKVETEIANNNKTKNNLIDELKKEQVQYANAMKLLDMHVQLNEYKHRSSLTQFEADL